MNVAQAAAWCRASSLPTVSKLKYLALLVFVGSVSLNLYYAYVPTKYTLAPFTVVRSDVCEWPIPSDMKLMVSHNYDSHWLENVGIPTGSTRYIQFKKMDEQSFVSEMNESDTYTIELMSDGPVYTLYKMKYFLAGQDHIDFRFLSNEQAITFGGDYTEKDVLAMFDHCKATLLDS